MNVARTQVQFAVALRVKPAVCAPVDEMISVSSAAREVFVSCCSSVYPVPAVTVAVELLGRPSPPKTSSFAAVVVAVGPHVGLVPDPCAEAV